MLLCCCLVWFLLCFAGVMSGRSNIIPICGEEGFFYTYLERKERVVTVFKIIMNGLVLFSMKTVIYCWNSELQSVL